MRPMKNNKYKHMKKNICFIVSSPYSFFFLKVHLEKLSKYYHIHLVANINDTNSLILDNFEHKSFKNIPIQRSINITKDIHGIYKLYKYFKSNSFDAIHSLTPKAGLTAAIAGKLAGVGIRVHIFTGQVWATKKGAFRYLLKKLDQVIANWSTHILVDGNSQRDFLISEKILKVNQGQVLGAGSICGVDLNRFAPNVIKRSELRKQLNISDDWVVFLFIGRITEDKGVIELAKAFNKLRLENKNAYLLVAGFDEGALEAMKEIIKDKAFFNFVGKTDTPEMYYQSCDVFCLPSYREGFGMSVIEASACGIPVICSDAYGLLDTIIDNQTGLRHKVKNVNDLYDKMKLLANDKNLRSTLGAQGLKYTSHNFSSEDISNAWVEFYKNLV